MRGWKGAALNDQNTEKQEDGSCTLLSQHCRDVGGPLNKIKTDYASPSTRANFCPTQAP